MALIEFEHLRKVYADSVLPAVDDLNLHIEAGEFLTLLGPSGSGKTTTLMLLAGFETPTRAHPARRPADRGAAAAQAQHGRGVPELLAVPAHDGGAERGLSAVGAQGGRGDEARAGGRRAGQGASAGLRQRRPQQLSGGQQQRVALARALVFEPRLVLMDEPLSALDKKLREEMQLEIRRLHRELGVTMVYVTHDQSEAMTLSDRVAVFNQGASSSSPRPSSCTTRRPIRSSPASSATTT